jgi:hypothetical protein
MGLLILAGLVAAGWVLWRVFVHYRDAFLVARRVQAVWEPSLAAMWQWLRDRAWDVEADQGREPERRRDRRV